MISGFPETRDGGVVRQISLRKFCEAIESRHHTNGSCARPLRATAQKGERDVHQNGFCRSNRPFSVGARERKFGPRRCHFGIGHRPSHGSTLRGRSRVEIAKRLRGDSSLDHRGCAKERGHCREAGARLRFHLQNRLQPGNLGTGAERRNDRTRRMARRRLVGEIRSSPMGTRSHGIPDQRGLHANESMQGGPSSLGWANSCA